MKTSRAPVQSPRISASVRLTCLPGRLPRTSKSLAMTSSTSVGPEAAVDEDAIHPCSERRPPAARAEAAQLRLAAQGQQGISEAPEGCSDLLHGSWRPPRPKLTQHGSGATRAITRALREPPADKVGKPAAPPRELFHPAIRLFSGRTPDVPPLRGARARPPRRCSQPRRPARREGSPSFVSAPSLGSASVATMLSGLTGTASLAEELDSEPCRRSPALKACAHRLCARGARREAAARPTRRAQDHRHHAVVRPVLQHRARARRGACRRRQALC